MTLEEETSLKGCLLTQEEADEIDRKITEFLRNQEETPDEFIKAVDEHFWEMI